MKRVIYIFTVFVLLLSAFAIPSLAYTSTGEWFYYDDGTFDMEGEEFKFVTYSPVLRLAGKGYDYQRGAHNEDKTEYLRVYAPSKDSSVRYLENTNGGVSIYAKKGEDVESYKSFVSEESYGFARLMDLRHSGYSWRSELTESELRTIITSSASTRVFDVRELFGKLKYNICLFDSTDTLYYSKGAIFQIDNSLWYLDLSTLTNDCFDAYGNLSYRKGELTLSELDTATSKLVGEKESQKYAFYDEYEYEEYTEPPVNIEEELEDARLAVNVTVAILGFTPSVLLLAYSGSSLIKKRKEGLDIPLVVTGCASILWLVLSIVIVAII